MYVIESEVANFVQSPTLHHLTGILTLIIISNHKENGSVMALISLDTWKKGGDLEEGYKIGYYVEGIKVRCTEVCDVICVLFLLLFRMFDLESLCQASPFVAVLFSVTKFKDTFYVL